MRTKLMEDYKMIRINREDSIILYGGFRILLECKSDIEPVPKPEITKFLTHTESYDAGILYSYKSKFANISKLTFHTKNKKPMIYIPYGNFDTDYIH